MVLDNYRFQTSWKIENFHFCGGMFSESSKHCLNFLSCHLLIFNNNTGNDGCPGSLLDVCVTLPAMASLGQQALFFPIFQELGLKRAVKAYNNQSY